MSKWLAGRDRHRRNLHRSALAAIDRHAARIPFRPAQRSRRQQKLALTQQADLTAEAVDDLCPRVDARHQRHRRGPRRARRVDRHRGGLARTVLDIARAGRQHLYRLDLPPQPRSAGSGGTPLSPGRARRPHGRRRRKRPDTTPRSKQVVRQAKTATVVESVAVIPAPRLRQPGHERALGAALDEGVPFVPRCRTRSIPETREFERTATTVLNASVMPIAARYLDRLQREVQGSRLHVMHSAGGMASPEAAARRPLAMAPVRPGGRHLRRAARGRLARSRQGPELRHGRHDDRCLPDRRKARPRSPPIPSWPGGRCGSPWSPSNRSAPGAARW